MLTLYFSETLWAKDVGIRGPVYSIQELDFLEWIEQRLKELQKTGQFTWAQTQLQEHAMAYVKRPKAVMGITRAIEDRVFTYDPAITLTHDITDQEGNIFYKAGTRISPLKHFSLHQPLLFFDGDDKKQVQWAHKLDQQFKGNTKLILVNGSILDQISHWQRPVYFDQQGKLINKLRILHVPAIVLQKGELLQIKEVKLNE